jgi:hypothetical protein
MAARKTGKGRKPVRKSSPAAPRSSKKAKRARPAVKSARSSRTREDAPDVVYTDIRRSMHGAILRHLR